MSDTPIFDRLAAERSYTRLTDYKPVKQVDPRKFFEDCLREPDEFLDGPSHMIGAQVFDGDHIEMTPLVEERLVAGLKGTPFERESLRYFSDSALSPTTKAVIVEKFPHLNLKKTRIAADLSSPDSNHGTVLWNSEKQEEHDAEMAEMFQKHVSDTVQAINEIRDQGGIITKVEHVFEPDKDPKTVVEGEIPIYTPLSLHERQEE